SKTRPLRVTYVTVLPKRYRTGPLVSLSTIASPGVYSVIVPLASVVVVVVVVCETCPHANGATNAKAILNTIFFMFSPCYLNCGSANRPCFRLNSGIQRTCRYTGFGFVLCCGCLFKAVFSWS